MGKKETCFQFFFFFSISFNTTTTFSKMMNDRAAASLSEELQKIDDNFARGRMTAFGLNQHRVLEEFQDLRKKQADLAVQQVSMLSKTKGIEFLMFKRVIIIFFSKKK